MKSRTKAAALAAAAAATLVVAVAAPSGATASKSFAYGFSINGQGQQPYVESTDGSTQTGGGHIPPDASPLLSGGILDVSAGNDAASAKVVDVSLLNVGDQLPQQLKDGIQQLQAACQVFENAAPADDGLNQLNDGIDQAPGGNVIQIPTTGQANKFCKSLLDSDIATLADLGVLKAQCSGDSGSVTLADAKLLGASAPGVAGNVPRNTKLFPAQLAPAVDVTLNRQTQNPDGSFTVDGLVIDLGGGHGEIVIASATCGKPIAARTTSNDPPHHNAPAPSPVQRSLAVTG